MRYIQLITIALLFSVTTTSHAQNLSFNWSEPGTNSFSNADIDVCGASRTVRLRVSWNNDPNCPYRGWGRNRYRWTVKIFKDNNVISTRRFTSSSCWFNEFYDNFQVSSGVYRAHIQLEVRGFLWSWSIQASGNAGIINVTRQDATPSFTINGIVPNSEVPIEVCPAKILINPSATSCEENYYIGVWEFDYLNWDRPQKYEWGKWFQGEAPQELNLQQLSATYSFGNDFLGTDQTRQGEILYGGNLPNNNNPRYYYIKVCTGYPEWKCAAAVIKVKCDCH